MQYALLAYACPADRDAPGPITDAIAAILDRPDVTGWIRLHADSSATTLRTSESGTLLTDGPFIDSKEYLAGLILIEADNLDQALDIARDFQDARPPSPSGNSAIEVRPIFESSTRGT